jgi:UDP-N-acetylmuramoyl-tripeptide--D-alanyl-D-alanine ligase
MEKALRKKESAHLTLERNRRANDREKVGGTMPARSRIREYASTAARTLKSSRKAARNRLRQLYARANRLRCNAPIVAVTGSSAKTTTVALLSHILAGNSRVLTQVLANGLPTAIQTLRQMTSNDDYVILEAGTSGIGQLRNIARVIQPDVAIVTLVALEHYSAFRTLEAVAREKSELVRALSRSGLAILNADDPLTLAMSETTRARKVTFGVDKGDYRVRDLEISSRGTLVLNLAKQDQVFRLETRLVGMHNWLAVSAAAIAALELGCPSRLVAERVKTFDPVFGRMSLHHVDNGPTFILDTAKSPYHSIHLPLDALKAIAAPRKRFVLGQISDYPGSPVPRYRDTFRAAKAVADEVVLVGPNAKRARATEADIAEGRFKSFANVETLAEYIRATAIAGEVILLKSSQAMHLERIFLNFMDPVRCWPNECGYGSTCRSCGQFRAAFSDHPPRRSTNVHCYRGSLEAILQ